MEKIKLITEKLNELLNTDYNCFSFCDLTGIELLKIVLNVMCSMDIAKRTDSAPAVEIRDVLEAIKYVPDEKLDPEEFRNKLSEGSKQVLHPILLFLLTNIDSIKTRRYLSKYVTKIDVPDEALLDEKTAVLYKNHCKLIDDFWNVYSYNKSEKEKALETAELENDIWEMKNDLSNLDKRIDIQKGKLRSEDATKEKLTVVREYCKETARGVKLTKQLEEEKQKVETMRDTVRNFERRDIIRTLEDLIERSEYNKQSQKMCENVSLEITQELSNFKTVYDDKEPSDNEMRCLQEAADGVLDYIIDLKIQKESKIDENTELFINQTKMLAKRKAVLSKQVMKLRLRNEEILIKNEYIDSILGGDVLTGKNLKDYVGSLRQLSTTYKELKQKLNAMQNELGVLNRTLEILHLDNPGLKTNILEKKQFYASFTQDEEDQRNRVAKLYKQYDSLRCEFLTDDAQYKKLVNSYNELKMKYTEEKYCFDKATEFLSTQIDRHNDEYIQLQKIIETEMEELSRYVSEAENYKESLLKYSQCVIENVGDDPYINTVQHKLHLAEIQHSELLGQLEDRQVLIEKEREEMEGVKRVMSLVMQKFSAQIGL